MLNSILRRTGTLSTETGSIAKLLVQGLADIPGLFSGWRRFVIQLNRVGVESLPLALMIGTFTGMVVALQTGIVLKERFGATEQVGVVVGASLVREMGPVITAFILAGRVGSSIAAEIGTMAVSEELDALRSMGISPVRYLLVPRLYAMLIMQPLLTVFSVLIGIWGGGLVISSYLHFPNQIYLNTVRQTVQFEDIFDGFIKTFVFAALTVVISTRMGLCATRGAEGVGRATTSAVVASLATILVADFLMGRFLA